MFKAITKKNGPSSKGDVKGTLTALWASAGGKVGTSVAPPAQAAPPAADVEPQALFERQCTPEGARPNSALAAEAAAAPTTGGDVAIGAAPDASPEPAAALTIAVKANEQPDAAGDAALAKVCSTQCDGCPVQAVQGGTASSSSRRATASVACHHNPIAASLLLWQASNAADKADKKRKRSAAAEPFKEDQLTKLQVRYHWQFHRRPARLVGRNAAGSPWVTVAAVEPAVCHIGQSVHVSAPLSLSLLHSHFCIRTACIVKRLQALFAENEYANTAAKSALASELGVELVQV